MRRAGHAREGGDVRERPGEGEEPQRGRCRRGSGQPPVAAEGAWRGTEHPDVPFAGCEGDRVPVDDPQPRARPDEVPGCGSPWVTTHRICEARTRSASPSSSASHARTSSTRAASVRRARSANAPASQGRSRSPSAASSAGRSGLRAGEPGCRPHPRRPRAAPPARRRAGRPCAHPTSLPSFPRFLRRKERPRERIAGRDAGGPSSPGSGSRGCGLEGSAVADVPLLDELRRSRLRAPDSGAGRPRMREGMSPRWLGSPPTGA